MDLKLTCLLLLCFNFHHYTCVHGFSNSMFVRSRLLQNFSEIILIKIFKKLTYTGNCYKNQTKCDENLHVIWIVLLWKQRYYLPLLLHISQSNNLDLNHLSMLLYWSLSKHFGTIMMNQTVISLSHCLRTHNLHVLIMTHCTQCLNCEPYEVFWNFFF